MSTFTRNMTFHTKDLGRAATLVLTFDIQSTMPGNPYQDYFPTAWRVVTFAATGSYSMTATYQSQLAFVKPQVQSGIILHADTWMDLNVGQSTTLTESNDIFHFSTPVPGVAGYVQCINGTPWAQDIGLGFDNHPPSAPATVLYFPAVGAGYSCLAQFKPILRAYIISNFQQGQILTGEILTPVIWHKDLRILSTNTSFTLSYDPSTGTYSINQDNAALSLDAATIKLLSLGQSDFEQFSKLLKKDNSEGSGAAEVKRIEGSAPAAAPAEPLQA